LIVIACNSAPSAVVFKQCNSGSADPFVYCGLFTPADRKIAASSVDLSDNTAFHALSRQEKKHNHLQ